MRCAIGKALTAYDDDRHGFASRVQSWMISPVNFLVLNPERQSARMSEIKTGRLGLYGKVFNSLSWALKG